MLKNFLCQLRRVIRIGATGKDHEFITAEAGNGVATAQDVFKALANVTQQLIADGMSERIVDDLETIKVEEKQQAALFVARRHFNGVRQPIIE